MKYGVLTTFLIVLSIAINCNTVTYTNQVSALSKSISVPTYSELWGERGEQWTPKSRLPVFSFAGYHCGEQAIPNLAVTHSILDFEAAGDGEADDTEAFKKAFTEVDSGVIFIPPGRYKITDILSITNSHTVLRGAGPDSTILYFPTVLNDIKPNWGATTSGQRTSNYSWSGAFLWLRGSYGSEVLTPVASPAKRGNFDLMVASTESLYVGREIEIFLRDDSKNSLARHLYSDDPGNMGKLDGRTTASLVARITELNGHRLRLDRPLRFDIKPQWLPLIRAFEPTVSESGVEHLSIEFPITDYKGHFTELGYNALAMQDVVNCWIRNVTIRHADSGIFASGRFCSIDSVVFESDRKTDWDRNSTGHHGIYLSDDDNLFTRFDFRTRFIHDITVSMCAGNVISDGRGTSLCLDHHKRAPYENLFTNLDAGQGDRLWMCGGGSALGRHCAARGTFWTIFSQRPLSYPDDFGPWSMNLVGLNTNQSEITKTDGRWFEVIPPQQMVPANLHQAQLQARLKGLLPHSEK